MGICSVPSGRLLNAATPKVGQASSPGSASCQPLGHSNPILLVSKYKAGASQSRLNRELLHHKAVTICQSGLTAGSARTRPAGLTTRHPPHLPSLRATWHGHLAAYTQIAERETFPPHICSCLSGITPDKWRPFEFQAPAHTSAEALRPICSPAGPRPGSGCFGGLVFPSTMMKEAEGSRNATGWPCRSRWFQLVCV
jgi:hypothetical protein